MSIPWSPTCLCIGAFLHVRYFDGKRSRVDLTDTHTLYLYLSISLYFTSISNRFYRHQGCDCPGQWDGEHCQFVNPDKKPPVATESGLPLSVVAIVTFVISAGVASWMFVRAMTFRRRKQSRRDLRPNSDLELRQDPYGIDNDDTYGKEDDNDNNNKTSERDGVMRTSDQGRFSQSRGGVV